MGQHGRTGPELYRILTVGGAYVVVDEEADPGFWVVQGAEPLQELLHEGRGVFDEDRHEDQRQLLVLKHSVDPQHTDPSAQIHNTKTP